MSSTLSSLKPSLLKADEQRFKKSGPQASLACRLGLLGRARIGLRPCNSHSQDRVRIDRTASGHGLPWIGSSSPSLLHFDLLPEFAGRHCLVGPEEIKDVDEFCRCAVQGLCAFGFGLICFSQSYLRLLCFFLLTFPFFFL